MIKKKWNNIKSLLVLPAFREISLIWGSMVFGAVFAFLTQVLLARALPVSHYGAVATVISITSVFGSLASVGVGYYWLLLFAQKGVEGRRWLKPSILLICLTSSIVICALMFWGAFFWTDGVASKLLYWLCPIIFMQALIELNISKFQLEGKFKILAFWQFMPHLGRTIIAVLVITCDFGIKTVAVGYFITTLIIILVNVFSLWPLLKGKIELKKYCQAPNGDDRSTTKKNITICKVFKKAFPFGLSGVFGLLYGRADIIILGLFIDTSVAGYYNVAISVLAAVYLLPQAITQKYLLPRIQQWAAHDQERFLSVFRFGNGVMLLLGFSAMICLGVLGPVGLPVLFGEKYDISGTLILFLSCCVPLKFLASNLGAALVTGPHITIKNRYQGYVLTINIILNLIFIPFFGIYGAVGAKIVSEICLVLFYLMGTHNHVFGKKALQGWTLKLKVEHE